MKEIKTDRPMMNPFPNILVYGIDEVHRLEGTVASLTEEAGRRAQAEVSKVKDDYNNKIKKISQEIVRLEIVNHLMFSEISEYEMTCQ